MTWDMTRVQGTGFHFIYAYIFKVHAKVTAVWCWSDLMLHNKLVPDKTSLLTTGTDYEILAPAYGCNRNFPWKYNSHMYIESTSASKKVEFKISGYLICSITY
jgi:hypothetical protein